MQVHQSASFSSRIPRFDHKSYMNTGLRKSVSHFNTKEALEDGGKRRSDPDILRSASIELVNPCDGLRQAEICHQLNKVSNERSICGDLNLKREELSLSHIPALLSDMDDDNASLDSLGILTPNQMKDFVGDEAISDSNIVEVIDINGHKIECKLHYEDMQWSSPFLNLSGGKDILGHQNITCESEARSSLENDVKSGDDEFSSTVSDLIKAQSLHDGGYAVDNESDICLNNQQIIEIIHKASAKQEKNLLSLVPLSESGYHADNESDVLSDATPSPVEEQYKLPEADGSSLQRESVTDSGFYSESRSSCVVGSESDFDDVPHSKSRSVQIIDGHLYCGSQKMSELVEISLAEPPTPVIQNGTDSQDQDDVTSWKSELDSSIKSSDIKTESKGSSDHEDSEASVKLLSISSQTNDEVINNRKNLESLSPVPKSPKKPKVKSKLKQVLDCKSKDDIPDEVRQRRSTAQKKGRWDSITARIAASMADDKKLPRVSNIFLFYFDVMRRLTY